MSIQSSSVRTRSIWRAESSGMLARIRLAMSTFHLLLPILLALQSDGGPRERFQALHAKGDAKGCAALWSEKPELALPTIEKDLDEALALRVGGKEADAKAAAALEARALWGARVASDA